MNSSGIQLIAELDGCPANLLDDEEHLKVLLIEGIENCGMFHLNTISHKYEPIGVTVISIIKESHIAIHTYPEAQHASVDIFHCSTDSKALFQLLEFLKVRLKAKTMNYMEIHRGHQLALSENSAKTLEGVGIKRD
ncbi:MAG: adenosylmethionine decarboxylase [bacterium]